MESGKYRELKKILKICGTGLLLSVIFACKSGVEVENQAGSVTESFVAVPDVTVPVLQSEDRVSTEGDEAAKEVAEHFSDAFTSRSIREGDEVYNRIIGKSYVENPHVDLEELCYLTLLHFDFNHEVQIGELITHKAISEEVLEIFKRLYEAEYEIESIYLIDNYWQEDGDGVLADAESMRQNNTSCFNYRVVPDSKSISKHALGYAIDINPRENPYVVFDKSGNQVLKGGGDASYMDRSHKRPHMIDHEDLAYEVFSQYGFQWGGDWSSSRDYQHFVKIR